AGAQSVAFASRTYSWIRRVGRTGGGTARRPAPPPLPRVMSHQYAPPPTPARAVAIKARREVTMLAWPSRPRPKPAVDRILNLADVGNPPLHHVRRQRRLAHADAALGGMVALKAFK